MAKTLVARNLDTGSIVAERVTVAETKLDRGVGLLSRDHLDPGEALLIVPCRGVHTWWMRFTIDIVALNADGRVIDAVAGLRPWRVRLPRRGSVSVLELPEGTLAASKTKVGHRIVIQ